MLHNFIFYIAKVLSVSCHYF